MSPRPISSLRVFISRQMRDLPPGRRLRLRLAIETVERRFGAEHTLRVLDAGSEEALLCLELARRHPAWLLVAADLAEAALRRGRRWAVAEELSVRFVVCDLQRTLAESAFDVVTALESLVEIPDDHAAMATMVAALRPGGMLVLQVPTADWTPVLRGAERIWRREVRHGYREEDLMHLLVTLGLEVQQVIPTFRRATALAQDVRDRFKRHGRWAQLWLLPVMAGAVALERAGLTWGPPRALFVVAVKS